MLHLTLNQTTMRICFTFIISLFLAFPFVLHAAVMPPTNVKVHPPEANQKIISLKIKDVQKLLGRKLTFKEKISFVVLKHALKKRAAESKQGQTALGFGIAAVVMLILGLFIPYVIIGALIAAILAVVLGSVAKKQDPSDRKAYAATLLGWITLGGIALLILLAIAILASWGWY
jgi:hypothetical protein